MRKQKDEISTSCSACAFTNDIVKDEKEKQKLELVMNLNELNKFLIELLGLMAKGIFFLLSVVGLAAFIFLLFSGVYL